MYVASRGLSAYRRGFGTIGPLNCPGDPGCPGYVEPGSPEYIASLQDELARVSTQTTPEVVYLPAPAGDSLTSMINANAGKLAIGAGVFLGAMFLMRAAR